MLWLLRNNKNLKPPGLVGLKIVRGLEKKNVLIIISVLSISEKKASCQ